jgi:hypothetical protein
MTLTYEWLFNLISSITSVYIFYLFLLEMQNILISRKRHGSFVQAYMEQA